MTGFLERITDMELQEILDFFLTKDNFTILTHKSPDGDTLGSGFALCFFLRGLGKHANVLNSDKLPERYGFLFEGYEPQDFKEEYVVAVDIADRTAKRSARDCGSDAKHARGVQRDQRRRRDACRAASPALSAVHVIMASDPG